MYWGGQHHNICDLLLNSLEKIHTHALKICIEKKRKYDKMIIVVESRWLLYRGAHCTIMKLFCIFEKFNNKQLGRKVHNLLISPKPSPPFAFPVSENGAIVCSIVDTWKLLVQHTCAGTPLSQPSTWLHNDVLCRVVQNTRPNLHQRIHSLGFRS